MGDLESLRQIYEEYAEHDDTKASNTDIALRDALAVIEAQEKEIARVTRLAIEGINTDGAHHKQWFLEEIANVRQDMREGIPA